MKQQKIYDHMMKMERTHLLSPHVHSKRGTDETHFTRAVSDNLREVGVTSYTYVSCHLDLL